MTVTTVVAAFVLADTDALELGSQPDGCERLAVPASAKAPHREALEEDQLVFADLVWEVRTLDGAPTTVGTWAREQVEVRADGALILRQEQRDGEWQNAEVHSVHRGFGYGTYEWTIESPLHDLDPVVVLGLFTFERGAPGGREIDIEVAQWGDPTADNMNFVSWFPDRLARTWTIDVDGPTTHQFTWSPQRIVWCSTDANGDVLAWASRPTTMEPGDERVHMNLWISRGQAPEEETEVIITDFRFRPLAGAPPNR